MRPGGWRAVRAASWLAAVVGAAQLLALPAAQAAGALYVDRTMSTCDDWGPGSSTAPYCTIAKAVSQLQPGSTLYVGNGSYAETITFPVSGTADAGITVTAWPAKHPVVGSGVTHGVSASNQSYLTVSGLVVTGTTGSGISVVGGSHVAVVDNEVTYAGQPVSGKTAPGIYLRGTWSGVVQGNRTHDNSSHGILLTGGTTGMTVLGNVSTGNAEGYRRNANGIDVLSPGNAILANVTHDNEDSGINIYPGGDNSLVADNVTYNNGDHGIDNLNVTGGRLIGNTAYRNCTTGINVEGTSGNYLVENNVAVDNAVYPAYKGISCNRRAGNIGIWDSAPASTTVDHNLVNLTTSGKPMYVFGSSYTSLAAMTAATGQEQHGVQGDPLFADAAAWDLSLTAGSPAIDRANSGVSGEQPTDVLGNPRVDDPYTPNTYAEGPRPYDDLGAYEFQAASGPRAPVARLAVSPTSGTVPLAVTADASGSSDPQGQALSYRFDFGDGTVVGPQSGATAAHMFTAAGTYAVVVTVTDTSGLSSSASQTVTGSSGPRAPVARLAVSPTSGTVPLAVTADASGSSDPQGQALSYRFDFGDGTVVGPQSGATAAHMFTAAGTYAVVVTVTDTSGLSSSASQTVTGSSGPRAPVARLAVSPTSGTVPLAVTADASGSSDPQGQALSYRFDFGDGTVVGPQSGATAAHTFTAAGTYAVVVTVTDTSGLSSSASQAVTGSTSSAADPVFVGSIANNYSTRTHTSGSIIVWRAAGVQAGHLVVLTVQLSGTGATGTVSGTDVRGNAYAAVATAADGAGNRLVVLAGVATTPLATNDKITVSFPSAATYRISGDEFAGATQLDQATASTGASSTFSSGVVQAASSNELAFGAVSVTAGTANPTWSSGWNTVGTYSTSNRYLGKAFRVPPAGSVEASGGASGPWLAVAVIFGP